MEIINELVGYNNNS